MSTGGRHVAVGGSYGRSTGGAAMRGAGLLAIAVILGIVLLQAFDKGSPYRISSTTANSAKPATASGSGAPPGFVVPPTTPTRPPSAVKVLAANASGIALSAAHVSDQALRPRGYNILAPTNATMSDLSTSKVEYAAGFDAEAKVLAAALGLPDTAAVPIPTPAPVPDTRGADILVIVGRDLANRYAPGSSGETTGGGTTGTPTPTPTHRTTTPTTAHTATTRPGAPTTTRSAAAPAAATTTTPKH